MHIKLLLSLLLVLAPIDAIAAADISTNFTLNSQCPPSFEKTKAGVCELRNMYQFYNSVQGRGLGGTQT